MPRSSAASGPWPSHRHGPTGPRDDRRRFSRRLVGDVWICIDARGHIQATGTDARGRKQYRYHDAWRQRRDREKFDHMIAFAAALPRLRAKVGSDLAGDDLSRARVLACATRLLDLGFFRIGTEGYAEENQTYGLATIHKRHVQLLGDATIGFDYVAKGGKRRIQSVVDPDVYTVVEALKGRRGGKPELLAWRDGRRWVDVRSTDINDYAKEAMGGDFTAKDFGRGTPRCWPRSPSPFPSKRRRPPPASAPSPGR